MASISKVGRKYEVRWRTPDRGSRRRMFTREKDARDFAATIDAEVRTRTYVDTLSGRQLLRDRLVPWLENRIDIAESTRAKQDSLARTHVLPAFGDRAIAEITQVDVAEWVATMHRSGLAPGTTQAAYAVLAGVMNAAISANQIRQSPCAGVKLPKVDREDITVLNHAEVALLADCVPERYRALVLLQAYGGTRIGEASSLRRHRLNLLRGTVTVATTASEVRGRWTETRPKTAASRRTVPLPADVVVALREHVELYAQPDSEGLVFTAPEGGPLRVASFRRRVWTPATKAAGVDPLRIHDLRHSAISMWISAGATLLQVKTWAGHTKSSFSLDRYGHLFEDDASAVLERLGERMAEHRSADVVPLGVRSVAIMGSQP